MRTPKKPPPDTVGNVRGRIAALKLTARQNAKMTEKEGGDYNRALTKELKALEPALKKLHARLEKARKKAPSSPVKPGRKKRKKSSHSASQKPQKRAKQKGRGKVPEDYDDLLATLNDL